MAATAKGLSDEKAADDGCAARGRNAEKVRREGASVGGLLRRSAHYAAEARPLIAANAEAALLRKGSQLRDLTHCKYGHPFSGTNLYVRPSGSRTCLTCGKRRASAPRPPTADRLKQVTAALNAGKPLRLICQGLIGAHRGAPRIVSFNKLNSYRRQNPDFDRFVLSATVKNNSKGQLQCRRPQQARIDAIRAENNDYYKILAMLPSGFPGRDDVVSDIFETLLNGSLRREDVRARVQSYIAAHNRMFPTRFAKFGDSPLVSVDEVLFEDGATTRADTVSSGLWD
jgi:hypothetical protein